MEIKFFPVCYSSLALFNVIVSLLFWLFFFDRINEMTAKTKCLTVHCTHRLRITIF